MDTAADKPCLELKHVSIEFHGLQALNDISLSIEKHEIVSIIGPNGAGKTTLFDTVCGLNPHFKGSIHFCGEEITHWPTHRICHIGIARTFQIARPFSGMTTIENILVGLWFGMGRNRTPKRQDDEARELLRLVGLDSKADAIASELTLSELRRLEVARALATNPRLLLLDEMAAGLSPEAISRSVELVKALRNRGLTLLIIDHFLNLTARVSDRLIALDKGEIIAEGKPSEVLECPAVMSSYLGNRQQRDE